MYFHVFSILTGPPMKQLQMYVLLTKRHILKFHMYTLLEGIELYPDLYLSVQSSWTAKKTFQQGGPPYQL